MLFDELEEESEHEESAPAAKPVAGGGGLVPPREMAECFGYEDIEKKLLTLINENKLPHALIFAGPEGIGKSTLAFRLARFLFSSPSPYLYPSPPLTAASPLKSNLPFLV